MCKHKASKILTTPIIGKHFFPRAALGGNRIHDTLFSRLSYQGDSEDSAESLQYTQHNARQTPSTVQCNSNLSLNVYEHTRDIQMPHCSVSSSQSDILVTRMVATTCNDFHGDLC